MFPTLTITAINLVQLLCPKGPNKKCMIVHDIINRLITPPLQITPPPGIFEYSHEIRLAVQIILFLILFLLLLIFWFFLC